MKFSVIMCKCLSVSESVSGGCIMFYFQFIDYLVKILLFLLPLFYFRCGKGDLW